MQQKYNSKRLCNIQREHLLVLMEFEIQFTMRGMSNTKMKFLSYDDGGLWKEQSQDIDQ
jgi:hypothetical protein